MSEKKLPKAEEIQKEFEDFVKQRFGKHVNVLTQDLSGLFADTHKKNEPLPSDATSSCDLQFSLKPKDIKNYLDRFVIGQDEAKKALAIAVCDHYSQARNHQQNPDDPRLEFYSKQNVLLLGPTGVGKTYMIKQVAKLIGVPFVKADATRFSETGYIGANVDDLIKDLVQQAEGDLTKAQYGIVYLDEADKLATPAQHMGRDVSGRGVQLGLLKLMEETEVDLRSAHDPAAQMKAFMEMQQKGKVEKQLINTRHILFIVSGAFTGLEAIIAKRLHAGTIGFKQEGSAEPASKAETNPALLHAANTEDFIAYGFEPEFIGRLPVRVACDPLDAPKLYAILKSSEGSLVKQYEQAFRSYGIELTIKDEALQLIAEIGAKERTGARALMTIFERLLRDFKFELPSTETAELVIDKEVVQNPSAALCRILENLQESQLMSRSQLREIREFEHDFKAKYGMTIKFDEEACRLLCAKQDAKRQENPCPALAVLCAELLQSYEHGLKLIQQNTGQESFVLGAQVVSNPKQELERMVKDSYNLQG